MEADKERFRRWKQERDSEDEKRTADFCAKRKHPRAQQELGQSGGVLYNPNEIAVDEAAQHTASDSESAMNETDEGVLYNPLSTPYPTGWYSNAQLADWDMAEDKENVRPASRTLLQLPPAHAVEGREVLREMQESEYPTAQHEEQQPPNSPKTKPAPQPPCTEEEERFLARMASMIAQIELDVPR